jgi:cytoskeletal protein RodZ
LGATYWSDLSQIREGRKISIERIHSDTKIPLGVLREFEQDGLQSHENLNAIYRRKLVVAYAEAVGVDTDIVRRAMSSTLSGAYDGALARTYLDWKPSATSVAEESHPERERSRSVRSARGRSRRTRLKEAGLLDGTIVTALVMVAIVAAALLWIVLTQSNA